LPAQGGAPLQVTDDQFANLGPRWAPDGKWLYFASDRGGSMNLWRVPIEERSGRALGAPEPITTPATDLQHFSISRDGNRIAYSQATSDLQIYKIVFDPVTETAVGPPVAITQGSREYDKPDVSPDGRWLTFQGKLTGRAAVSIWAMRTDGTSLRQLTDDSFGNLNPRWAPDGRRIAFVSNRSGQNELWLLSPDGSGLRQLTFGAPDETLIGAGVWSPNGKRIAYGRVGKQPRIIEVDTPWTDQKLQPLTPFAEPNVQLVVTTWSPDGRRLGLATRQYLGLYEYDLDSRRYSQIAGQWHRKPFWLRDGRRMIIESAQGVNLLDPITGRWKPVFSLAPGYTTGGAISPNNRTIYSGVLKPEADIWLAILK
jgi:Tol biopolymer transport system component